MAIEVPAPRLGGTFIYCPHATVARVKKGRKWVEEVSHCAFKTRKLRKFRRHWIHFHAERTSEPEVKVSPPPKEPTAKYAEGDSRRHSVK